MFAAAEVAGKLLIVKLVQIFPAFGRVGIRNLAEFVIGHRKKIGDVTILP